MFYIGVLCLAACAFAQPAVYVSRTSYEPPVVYYYPLDASLQEIAIAEKKDGGEVIVTAIPEAPLLPLSVAELEPELENKSEGSSEEIKKENEEEAKPKAIILADDASKPVVVRFAPPQFITNLITSLPISLPDWPILGSLFPKPTTPVVVPEPVETARYRVRYVYPSDLKLGETVIEQL